jgi:hypothetical protein
MSLRRSNQQLQKRLQLLERRCGKQIRLCVCFLAPVPSFFLLRVKQPYAGAALTETELSGRGREIELLRTLNSGQVVVPKPPTATIPPHAEPPVTERRSPSRTPKSQHVKGTLTPPPHVEGTEIKQPPTMQLSQSATLQTPQEPKLPRRSPSRTPKAHKVTAAATSPPRPEARKDQTHAPVQPEVQATKEPSPKQAVQSEVHVARSPSRSPATNAEAAVARATKPKQVCTSQY